MDKDNLTKIITVSDMEPIIHGFKPNENKVEKLTLWLKKWIEESLKSGKIKYGDKMPIKGDLAFHISVSQGTIQNVYRQLENMGYLESKQRLGTYIKNRKANNKIEKLTSKREFAQEEVKKYLNKNSYKVGDTIPSSRNLAKIINVSPSTLQFVFLNLMNSGILKKENKSFVIINTDFRIKKINTKTLVEKNAILLKKYIEKNLKTGDKLPSNNVLAEQFNVSVKTIHDSVKLLTEEGVLHTRRGKYGTIVVNNAEDLTEELYHYEKILNKIKRFIQENCKTNDKLPTLSEFAVKYGVSTKTIKKALDILADDGYIGFMRGRYGGTFVLDIPQASKDAYTWLAISSDYFSDN